MPRCQGTTKTGNRCKLPALEGEKFCHHHLPMHTTSEDILETIPLNQRIIGILLTSRYQLILVSLVFVITFIFSRDKNYLAASIEIPHELVVEFFSALSQALGALLGVLIVFLTFRLERISQERNATYDQLKSEIEELERFYAYLPNELDVFRDDIALILRNLRFLRMKDLPIEFSSHYDGLPWHELTQGFVDKLEKVQAEGRSWSSYLGGIGLVIAHIERILERVFIQYISFVTAGVLVKAVVKLAVLLGASIVLLLVFGTIDRHGIFPDVRLPVVFAIVTWLLITLFELVQYTRRLYRDTREPWE
jgi:hypothetical protein